MVFEGKYEVLKELDRLIEKYIVNIEMVLEYSLRINQVNIIFYRNFIQYGHKYYSNFEDLR
jgi:hypothetical protein